MIRLTRKEFTDALRAIGLTRGDLLYCQSQLYSLGSPEAVRGRKDFCDFFIDGVREVIGPEGTLVIPTMSTQIGRGTDPYDPATTPSNYGTLPHYVANHPDFTRSLNPLISIAAQGPLAQDICGPLSTNNFNYFSPFDAMVKRHAKNLYLGVPLIRAMQLIHYCEFVVGVPYYYNKILDKRPVVDGIVSPKLVTSGVRFMTAEHRIDISRAVAVVEASGLVKKVPCGGDFVRTVPMPDIVRLVSAELEKDPFFLTDRTLVFQYGDAPHDGLQDQPPPPIRDPHLADRTESAALLLRLEAHSPRLARYLEQAIETADAGSVSSWLETLGSYSDAGLREFAWAFNEVAGSSMPEAAAIGLCNGDDDPVAQCAMTHLDRTRHTAHQFLVGYVFAPFAVARTRSLSVGGQPALHAALARRFSNRSPDIAAVAATATATSTGTGTATGTATGTGAPSQWAGRDFSDICLYAGWADRGDPKTALTAWGECLQRGGVLFAEIPVAAIDAPVENARGIEALVRARMCPTGLTFERLHLWRDRSNFSVILRKLST